MELRNSEENLDGEGTELVRKEALEGFKTKDEDWLWTMYEFGRKSKKRKTSETILYVACSFTFLLFSVIRLEHQLAPK